jgi:hypothetical protein
MTLRIKSPQDVGAAIILIAIGLAGLWFGRDYDIGSVSRMGPGYMPVLLSIGLLVFGAAIGLRAVTVDGPPIATGRWYPSLMILVAVLMFALLIERAGLAPTTFVVADLRLRDERREMEEGGRTRHRARVLLCRRLCLWPATAAAGIRERLTWTSSAT